MDRIESCSGFYHKQVMDYLRELKDAVTRPECFNGPVRVWDAYTGELLRTEQPPITVVGVGVVNKRVKPPGII